MNNVFKKAQKADSKLRMTIIGPPGSGKTYSALAIASGLGGKIALVDTEHGSAAKYADLFTFDTVCFEAPFHPDRYVNLLSIAAEHGYDVLVIDSLSHAWSGSGGLLEIVDQIAARMKTSNTFAAWKDATPIHNRLIEAMLSSPLHIIATMRSKVEYILEENNRGKKVPRKVGMAPIQRDGMEYEFDIVGEMDMDNRMIIQKTRCPLLAGKVIEKPGQDIANTLRAWLSGPDLETPKKQKKPQRVTPEVAEEIAKDPNAYADLPFDKE